VEQRGTTTPGIIEETGEFRTTRVDTGDGPEVIVPSAPLNVEKNRCAAPHSRKIAWLWPAAHREN
jgi:hypothetical protein